MNSLTNCLDCRTEILYEASHCEHCGSKQSRVSPLNVIGLLGAVYLFYYAVEMIVG